MRDWTGTRIREDALKVRCRYCGSPAGELCVSQDGQARELQAFPAHVCRVNDAQKAKKP